MTTSLYMTPFSPVGGIFLISTNCAGTQGFAAAARVGFQKRRDPIGH
jgi:hypothetical protein